MAVLVVPFRASAAARRLVGMPDELRPLVALAVLEDVLTACAGAGETLLVADAGEAAAVAARAGARLVEVAGASFNATVAAGITAAGEGPVAVVNADLPAVQPRDLLALVGSTPPGGLTLARAADGGTNALSLSAPSLFAPLYGTGSAERFFRHAQSLGVEATLADIPALADDVRSLGGDLASLGTRLGPHARKALGLPVRTAAA